MVTIEGGSKRTAFLNLQLKLPLAYNRPADKLRLSGTCKCYSLRSKWKLPVKICSKV